MKSDRKNRDDRYTLSLNKLGYGEHCDSPSKTTTAKMLEKKISKKDFVKDWSKIDNLLIVVF